MACRRNEVGYVTVAMHDLTGRRGIYCRPILDDVGRIIGLDVCGGREGDDYLATLRAGDTLSKETIRQLDAIFSVSHRCLSNIMEGRAEIIHKAMPEIVNRLRNVLHPSGVTYEGIDRMVDIEVFILDALQSIVFEGSVALTAASLGVSLSDFDKLQENLNKAFEIVFKDPVTVRIEHWNYTFHWKPASLMSVQKEIK